MNIFFLDRDPETAARLHSDQHIVKMPLETAQILCAVLHRYGLPAPYRPSHRHHPCVLWAGDSLDHYQWLRGFGLVLCAEYSWRRRRRHACEAVITGLPEQPDALPALGWSDPPQAMPEDCRGPDAVAAYRIYYARHKAVFPGKGPATWSGRERPAFMPAAGEEPPSVPMMTEDSLPSSESKH